MKLVKEDVHGRKYFVTYCDRCGKNTEGTHTCNPNPVIETLREQVQNRVDELSAMDEEVKRLRQQRDELVKVLEKLMQYAKETDEAWNDHREFDGWDASPEDEIFAEVRAALAKVKGE